MNRTHEIIFRLLIASVVICACFVMTIAQTPSPSPTPENPFAPEKADPLPAGMTGPDVNDPRAKLSPGFDNAGEAALGLKHVLLVQQPDAFQLGSDNPDDPKVRKTLGLMNIDTSKLEKSALLPMAQLGVCKLRPGVPGQSPVHGKLLWPEYLRHLRSRESAPVDLDDLSGWTERRFGLQEPALHVGRNAERPARLRYARFSARASASCRTREKPPPPPPAQKDRFRGVQDF